MKIRFLAVIALLLPAAFAWADDATPVAAPAAAATPVATPSPAPTPVPNTWKKQVITSATLNQASFNNWKQGGPT
jgi:hypothetical protein